MGFFGSGDTTSQSFDQRVATGGDEASVAQTGGVVGSGGSFVVGQQGRYSESGSILADTANLGNIQAGGNVTVGLQGDSVGQLVDRFTTASSDQVNAFNAALAKEQDAFSALAADSKKNNSFAWIAAAAIAALVLPGLLKK